MMLSKCFGYGIESVVAVGSKCSWRLDSRASEYLCGLRAQSSQPSDIDSLFARAINGDHDVRVVQRCCCARSVYVRACECCNLLTSTAGSKFLFRH